MQIQDNIPSQAAGNRMLSGQQNGVDVFPGQLLVHHMIKKFPSVMEFRDSAL